LSDSVASLQTHKALSCRRVTWPAGLAAVAQHHHDDPKQQPGQCPGMGMFNWIHGTGEAILTAKKRSSDTT